MLTPAEYAPQEAEKLHLLNTTGRYGPYEKHYVRKDGSRYPVLLNGMLVRDQAGQKFIWSFVEDISERKQIERLQNEFIATVNHELRTPLTAIKGSLGLLLSGVIATLPEQVIELLHMANNNTSRLTALVNDLLDLEKILVNKMPIELKACNLLNEVKEAILSIHSYAIKYGVTLKLVTELEQWVRVDPLRLQQVLANLLSNAVKFSPEGETVTIELTVLGNQVRVAVSDNGAGIPYAFRTRIFQKFAQADASDTRQKGGTGSGLAISKELIQRMAGSIDFISEEGKGTTFFIDLPCWHKEDVDVQ